jgi:4-amino-4-deoxy-L-arabinose transferase-like glycosyltransferase
MSVVLTSTDAASPRPLSTRLLMDGVADAPLLFLLSFIYLCIFRHLATMEPDEGILLQGAQRILAGQVPYRDFFSFYTPGSYYLLAALFRILGSSIVVARVSLAVTGALLSTFTYLLARRFCSRGVAATAGAVTTLSALPYRFLVLHNWDSTLWACCAIYSAVLFVEERRNRWFFAVGLFSALTVLFEQSKGAGLCLGLAVAFASICLLSDGKGIITRRSVVAASWGFALPFMGVFTYFARQNAMSPTLADWFWPLHHYSAANRVPYGYQNWSDETRHLLFASGSVSERVIKSFAISPCFWIPVLPLVAVGLLGYWTWCVRRTRNADRKTQSYIVVCAAMTGLLLSVVLGRADIIHIMYLQPLNCLVLAWCIEASDIPVRLPRCARFIVHWYAIAALVTFSMPPLFAALSAQNEVMSRRGLLKMSKKDNVVDYVQARVPAGNRILVYPYLPLYYYVTSTLSPSGYDYFQLGMNTPEQASEMLEQIRSQNTEVVLFEIGFTEKISHSWPGTPLSSISRDPVADYIARNYRSCMPLTSSAGWRFLFMVRKDLACQ